MRDFCLKKEEKVLIRGGSESGTNLEPERRVEAMRKRGDLRLGIWGREKVWVGIGFSLRAIDE